MHQSWNLYDIVNKLKYISGTLLKANFLKLMWNFFQDTVLIN